MSWSDQFIGIPYEEFNCAELCQVILKEVFGHDLILPQMPKTLVGMSKKINKEKLNYKDVDHPLEGDIVIMVCRGVASHIGIYLNGNKVIHAMKSANQSIVTPIWRLKSYGLQLERYITWRK